MSHSIQACFLVRTQSCPALNVFSDRILLANKTFGECLSKYCLDHNRPENLGQKIPFSVLKSVICALCKSPCLNFRHNCIGEKPEKNKPVNSCKLVENTFSRWSEGAQQQQMILLQIQCEVQMRTEGRVTERKKV